MRPDFSKISYKAKSYISLDYKKWREKKGIIPDWHTLEKIAVKPIYGSADLLDMEHLEYAAGIPPYLRGPYSTMYAIKPWTIRQYAG